MRVTRWTGGRERRVEGTTGTMGIVPEAEPVSAHSYKMCVGWYRGGAAIGWVLAGIGAALLWDGSLSSPSASGSMPSLPIDPLAEAHLDFVACGPFGLSRGVHTACVKLVWLFCAFSTMAGSQTALLGQELAGVLIA